MVDEFELAYLTITRLLTSYISETQVVGNLFS